jgi:hypothetical protein
MVYRINPKKEQGPQLEFAIVGSSKQTADSLEVRPISANTFHVWNQRRDKKGSTVQIFAAREKALKPKLPNSNPKTKLPMQYHEFLDIFDRKEAATCLRMRKSEPGSYSQIIGSRSHGPGNIHTYV